MVFFQKNESLSIVKFIYCVISTIFVHLQDFFELCEKEIASCTKKPQQNILSASVSLLKSTIFYKKPEIRLELTTPSLRVKCTTNCAIPAYCIYMNRITRRISTKHTTISVLSFRTVCYYTLFNHATQAKNDVDAAPDTRPCRTSRLPDVRHSKGEAQSLLRLCHVH